MSAEAMEDTLAYLLPAAAFESLVANPEALLRFARVLSLRLRALLNQVEDMSFLSVSARLARLLLQMAEPQGEVAAIPSSSLLNQQHLGCTRQMVNTSLGKLANEGIIREEARRIVILRPEELKKVADDN